MLISLVLRLYPAVPFNMRLATTDTTLPVGGGPSASRPILVRKGDVVCYSVGTMHRRTDLWGVDADKFRPGRWENFQPGAEYLPFNGGPRVCIGREW
jgi:cytochrome P450